MENNEKFKIFIDGVQVDEVDEDDLGDAFDRYREQYPAANIKATCSSPNTGDTVLYSSP